MNRHQFQTAEPHIFAFILFSSYEELLKVLLLKRIEVGENGISLLTPIKRWLKYKPADEADVTCLTHGNDNLLIKQQRILEAGWGIGFKISKIKKYVEGWHWSNHGRFELAKFCLPPNCSIDFSTDDWRRSVVVLFPSEKKRKERWPLKMYKATPKSRSYPLWPWMYVTKDYVDGMVGGDLDLEKHLDGKFKDCNKVSDSIIQPSQVGLWL